MQAINTEEFKQLRQQQDNLHVINVLPEDAFKQQHIPGSTNIPKDSDHFEDRVLTEVGDKSQPVVVYCASPGCDASPQAAQRLEASGFEKVYDYEGGTKAWSEAGEKVEAGA